MCNTTAIDRDLLQEEMEEWGIGFTISEDMYRSQSKHWSTGNRDCDRGRVGREERRPLTFNSL